MIIAVFKCAALLIWVLIFYLPVWLAHQLRYVEWRDRMVRLCCRGMLALCQVHVVTRGALSRMRPLMLVQNHISYLDVPILFSVFNARFTPKSEIGGWPVIGSICRMTDSIFVTRSAEKIQGTTDQIRKVLAAGDVVCLYPEATTGNGLEILPFKSGYFSVAEEPVGEQEIKIQPVAITYKSVCGLPIDRTQWPKIAWYGDMELLPHILEFLSLGKIRVELAFLEPVTMSLFDSRKAMAIYCQNAISLHIQNSRKEALISAQSKLLSLPLNWSKSKP